MRSHAKLSGLYIAKPPAKIEHRVFRLLCCFIHTDTHTHTHTHSDAKCMMEKAPGQTFGKMSLSTFEADVSKAKGDACYLQLETITGTKVKCVLPLAR